MKKVRLPIIILMAISLLAIPTISALSITEVELNPAGTDSGNEWLKLYSENLTNFTDLEITTNNDNMILNGTLSFQGYCILNFSSQFLDNNDEIITLKLGNQTLDQTIILTDTSNNNLTWQYDSNSSNWTFEEQALPSANNCVIIPPPTPPQNTTNQTSQNTTTSDNNETDEDNETTQDPPPEFIPAPSTSTSTTQQNETIKKIVLNAPSEKSKKKESFLSTKEQTRIFLLLSFTFLTVVIIILLALRKL